MIVIFGSVRALEVNNETMGPTDHKVDPPRPEPAP